MLTDAFIITRREIRDSLRDWRIVAPIIILTLVFPWIMNFSTRVAINFVEEYNATIIPLRLVPFAMMIVGFFPISFSLIIALETFVGEKERNSLEPLLGTPVTDTALYLGKLLSAMLLPLFASYLGVGSYLLGLFLTIQYVPEWIVFFQIVLLTTMESLVMVAGAVVVSSHTTSVRAANLLASFIIIPMAFLLQGESVLLFWGQYDVLWYIIAALFVADIILIRTGIRTFNREEILAREIDELNFGSTWRKLRGYFSGAAGKRFSLISLYTQELPRLLRENQAAIGVTVLTLLIGGGLGALFAAQHPLPAEAIPLFRFNADAFKQQFTLPGYDFLPNLDTRSIFSHNVRALLLSALLGVFSFGSLALILLAAPMGLVGFLAAQAAPLGLDPVTFLAAFILPHGIFELPAAILATAFALRLGASMIAPPAGMTAGENLLRAFAELVQVFVFIVLPLLLVAAWVEANVTPQIVLWIYGR
ncbi:MAG: stage II sporulation protein M [Chloroflexi bacterium]|nr:stage II sporulation protein M [Chloroflexota bacterium]